MDDREAYMDDIQASDLSLPPFANAANRKLNAELRAAEQRLQQLHDQYEEGTDRMAILTDHLKHVEMEHQTTQALIEAKKKEAATERHLRQLATHEAGRFRTDKGKAEKTVEELRDKLTNLKHSILQQNEKLEAFKAQMNWNQEELLQWSLAAKQKEEDKEAVAAYAKQDSVVVKNLTLQNEKLARLVTEAKSRLEEMVTEAQSVQVALDKAAADYKKIHAERQLMIQQWKDAYEAMNKRDTNIDTVQEEVQELKARLREKEQQARQASFLLEQTMAENKQLYQRMSATDRAVEKKRELLLAEKKSLEVQESEVETLSFELQKAQSELKQTLAVNSNLVEMKEEKEKRLDDAKALVESTKHALENEFKNTDDLADRAKQVEALYDQSKARLVSINKDLAALKEQMFKKSKELFDLRKTEADLIAEISGAQSTSRNLSARVHELDNRSLKQQEMLYNIEFQVQQLERKVAFASGKRSIEETNQLKEQIAQLQRQHEIMRSQYAMINTQVRKLEEDLQARKRAFDKLVAEKQDLQSKNGAIELENTSFDRELKEHQKKLEEMIVEHDVLKLEVKKLQGVLETRADAVFELENQKSQLQLAMREREFEIEKHRELRRAELKTSEEARHKVATELKERFIKIDKLKRKFETIAAKMGEKPEVKEEHSQAYYIIAAAQEREELQREGDSLHREIQKTEKELLMLQASLGHLNDRNMRERSLTEKVDPGSQEAQLVSELDEQQRTVIKQIGQKRALLNDLLAEREDRRQRIAELTTRIGQLRGQMQEQEREYSVLRKAGQTEEEKLGRAMRSLLAKRQEFRLRSRTSSPVPSASSPSSASGSSPKGDGKEPTPEDLYIQSKELEDRQRHLELALGAIVRHFPNLQDSILAAFEEAGVRLTLQSAASPSGQASARSTRSSRQDASRPTSAGSTASFRSTRSSSSSSSPTALPPISPSTRLLPTIALSGNNNGSHQNSAGLGGLITANLAEEKRRSSSSRPGSASSQRSAASVRSVRSSGSSSGGGVVAPGRLASRAGRQQQQPGGAAGLGGGLTITGRPLEL